MVGPPEETNNQLLTDELTYYKVEKWTKDGMKIDRLLYAGNNLEKARELFAEEVNVGRASGSRLGSGRACWRNGRRTNSEIASSLDAL